MTDETKKELMKAFAYGYTAEEVADVEEISIEEATKFAETYKTEIESRKQMLSQAGWM